MKKSKLRKALKGLLCLLAALILLAGAYVAYVFIAFSRLPDQLSLPVTGDGADEVRLDTPCKLVSFNIGFGAYEPDYSFFMDGGTHSWAFSRERLANNMEGICRFLQEQDADFLFLQEVDENATRTYHLNERELLVSALPDYDRVWAQNWNSPFLFYPITQPHGKTVCGIMTFSRPHIVSALRRSLPIEKGVMKLEDLDRCYSVSRVAVEGGRELVLYNMHLSAYTSDGLIATEQLRLLLNDMAAEYEKGNYACVRRGFQQGSAGGFQPLFWHFRGGLHLGSAHSRRNVQGCAPHPCGGG